MAVREFHLSTRVLVLTWTQSTPRKKGWFLSSSATPPLHPSRLSTSLYTNKFSLASNLSRHLAATNGQWVQLCHLLKWWEIGRQSEPVLRIWIRIKLWEVGSGFPSQTGSGSASESKVQKLWRLIKKPWRLTMELRYVCWEGGLEAHNGAMDVGSLGQWLQLRITLVNTVSGTGSASKWKVGSRSALEFKRLIRTRIKVKSWIRTRNKVKSRIRTRLTVNIQIRICVKRKSRIRISIKAERQIDPHHPSEK